MKKILLFVTLITFLVTSCEKDAADSAKQADLVQVDPNAAKYAEAVNNAVVNYLNTSKVNKDNGKGDDGKGKDKLKTKDFKISGSGAISYIPDGECGEGMLRFKSTGEAKSNLLGKVDQRTTFCVNPATEKALSRPTGTAEDKDGNKLDYALAGMGLDEASGFIYQIYEITGGTGEYKNATGNMTLLYHVFAPTNFAYTGKGTITY